MLTSAWGQSQSFLRGTYVRTVTEFEGTDVVLRL